MTSHAKKSPGRPRSLKSHQAMLQATLELLAQVGYESMSIEAIAARAGIGKTTIYRRYRGKAELVADAIESTREEVQIPDTGSLDGDLDALIESAAAITLNLLGRQTIAMIISSASSNPEFSEIYQTQYLQPRRDAFSVVIERAKARQEIHPDFDPGLAFDLMSGIMLHSVIFQPTTESWRTYVHRALDLIFKEKGSLQGPSQS